MSTKIFAFEGLGWGRYIERGIIKPLLAQGVNLEVTLNNWYQRCPLITGDKIIVLMHSMGAGGFNCLRATKTPIDLVITMDPRVTGRPYEKCPNVKRHINYYQTGFMRGYPVHGAENHIVKKGHVAIPFMPQIRKLVEEFLR